MEAETHLRRISFSLYFEFSKSIIDMDFPSAREADAKSTSEQRQVNKRGGWSCTVTTVRSGFALPNFI